MNDKQLRLKDLLIRFFKFFVILVAALGIGITSITSASIIGSPITVHASESSSGGNRAFDALERITQEEIRQDLQIYNDWVMTEEGTTSNVVEGTSLTQARVDRLMEYTSAGGSRGMRTIAPGRNAFDDGGGTAFATVYAELIMGIGAGADEDTNKTIPEDQSVAQAVDDGKVQFDIGYGYIATQGDDMNGNNAGTRLATFIASANHYGYFSTISGNSIARRAQGALVQVVNAIGGFIIKLSLVVMDVGSAVMDGVVEMIANLNPYRLLTSSEDNDPYDEPNRLYLVIQRFLNNIGINEGLFKAIIALALIIFSGIAGFQIMKSLQSGFIGNNVGEPVKKFFVRVATLALVIPLSAQLLSSLAGGLLEYSNENPAPYVVPSYIVDTKMWAVGSNLAPPRGVSLNGTPQNNYIDHSFAPSLMRGNIAELNQSAYRQSGQTETDTFSPSSLSFALLDEWMGGGTFGVNDYAHEVRKYANTNRSWNMAALQHPDQGDSALDNGYGPNDVDLGIIEGYIWSANPKLEDDNGPSSKTQAITVDGETTNHSYDGSYKGGVVAYGSRQSLSTQSVALLLQSSFENDKAVVYLENIPPDGIYEKLQNLTSVGTAWHTASLTGAGVTGKIGSYTSMLVSSLMQATLYIATILALLGGPFLRGALGAIRQLFETIIYGEPMLAVGGFALALGAGVTAIWASYMPSTVVSTVNELSAAILSLLTNDLITGSGLVEFISAVLSIGLVILLIKPANVGMSEGVQAMITRGQFTTSAYYTLVNIPLMIAESLNRRAMMASGGMRGMRARASMFGQAARGGQGMGRAGFAGQGAGDAYGSQQSEDGEVRTATDTDEDSQEFGAREAAERSRSLGDRAGSAISALAAGAGIGGAYAAAKSNGTLNDPDGLGVSEEEADAAMAGGDMDEFNQNANLDMNEELRDQLSDEDELYDEDGNRIDEYGNLIDENGNIIDEDGNIIEDKRDVEELYDEDGNLVDEDGNLIDENGNLIDEDGNLIDENGDIIKDKRADEEGIVENDDGTFMLANGTPLTDNEDGTFSDEDGNLYNENGQLIDEDGNLIDENGDIITDKRDGEQGIIENEDGTMMLSDGTPLTDNEDGTFSDEDGNLYNEDGQLIDDEGNLIEDDGDIITDKRDDGDADYVLSDGTELTQNDDGTFVDNDGNLYDESGNVIDSDETMSARDDVDYALADGTELTKVSDNAFRDADGNMYDADGQPIDADYTLEDGTELTANDDGTFSDIDGNTYNDDGELIDSSSLALDENSSDYVLSDGTPLTDTGTGTYTDATGNVYDSEGQMISGTGEVEYETDGTVSTINGQAVESVGDDVYENEQGVQYEGSTGKILNPNHESLASIERDADGNIETISGQSVEMNKNGTLTGADGTLYNNDGMVIAKAGTAAAIARTASVSKNATVERDADGNVEVIGGGTIESDTGETVGITEKTIVDRDTGETQTIKTLPSGKPVKETTNEDGESVYTDANGNVYNSEGSLVESSGKTPKLRKLAVGKGRSTKNVETRIEDGQPTTVERSTRGGQREVEVKEAQTSETTSDSDTPSGTTSGGTTRTSGTTRTVSDSDSEQGDVPETQANVQPEGNTTGRARRKARRKAKPKVVVGDGSKKATGDSDDRKPKKKVVIGGSRATVEPEERKTLRSRISDARDRTSRTYDAYNKNVPTSMRLDKEGSRRRIEQVSKVSDFIGRFGSEGSVLSLLSGGVQGLSSVDSTRLSIDELGEMIDDKYVEIKDANGKVIGRTKRQLSGAQQKLNKQLSRLKDMDKRNEELGNKKRNNPIDE